MVVTAESVQERGLSAGMSETEAAHMEAVEAVRREKRGRPDDGTEFCGVGGSGSGKIWDRLRRDNVCLGTFGTGEKAARAFHGAGRTNFMIPVAVYPRASATMVKAASGHEHGLSAGNCEIAEEHGDGVDAETKFENVHKLETPHDRPGDVVALSSLWSKMEMHALIQQRSNLLDMPCQEAGPKGLVIWEQISAGMRRMGYSRSAKQCRDKWWKMKYNFKKLKESNKERPEYFHQLQAFHQFEAFYRNKAALYANADRIEAFTVAVPISQRAPRPLTLPPGAIRLHGAAAKTNFEQLPTGATVDDDEKSSVDLLNDLPELNFTLLM